MLTVGAKAVWSTKHATFLNLLVVAVNSTTSVPPTLVDIVLVAGLKKPVVGSLLNDKLGSDALPSPNFNSVATAV